MELVADASDVDLLRGGDTAALVRRYYGPVYGLARRLLRHPGEARDAAQETFARAIAHLREFDPSRSFRAWIFAIAANHVRDLLRRRKQVALDPEVERELPDLAPPDARLLREENREKLAAAVDRLPFDLKIAVALHFQQELTCPEVAAALGVTVNSVRMRLYRALIALREDLR